MMPSPKDHVTSPAAATANTITTGDNNDATSLNDNNDDNDEPNYGSWTARLALRLRDREQDSSVIEYTHNHHRHQTKGSGKMLEVSEILPFAELNSPVLEELDQLMNETWG